MKNTLIIIGLILISSFSLFAQALDFNSPVSSSLNLSCKVIKPLSVDPVSSNDFIHWPTIPVGSKYVISSNNSNADNYSIFTFRGEPGSSVEITFIPQTSIDNVEISYRLKGTNDLYLGNQTVPPMNFDNGKTMVNLNSGGEFYMHIIYDWVWAKPNALTGIKHFVQSISAQYNGL